MNALFARRRLGREVETLRRLRDPRVAEAWASGNRLVLVTGHRRESWGGGLARVASAVATLAARHPDVQFIWPLHPNPAVRAEVGDALATQPNIIACEPLDYREVATVLNRCVMVITDSGGLQGGHDGSPANDLERLSRMAIATVAKSSG